MKSKYSIYIFTTTINYRLNRVLFELESGILKIWLRDLKGQFNCNGFKIFTLPMSFLFKIDLPVASTQRIFKNPQSQLQTSENLLKV